VSDITRNYIFINGAPWNMLFSRVNSLQSNEAVKCGLWIWWSKQSTSQHGRRHSFHV